MSKFTIRELLESGNPMRRIEGYYRSKLSRIGQSVYGWSIYPMGRLIERYTWRDGRAMVWKSEVLGVIVTPCIETAWNVNGEAIKWRAVFDFRPDMDIPTPELGVDECVVIYDLPNHEMRRSDCLVLCHQMADTWSTIRTQVGNQKTPMVAYAGNKKEVAKAKNAIVEIASGCKALFLDSDMMGQLQVLDFNAPYNVESLQKYLWSLEAEALEFMGIDSQDAFQKKERLIVDEQEGNDELLNYLLSGGLRTREQGAEDINRLFGLGISVSIQPNIRPIIDETEVATDAY